MGKDGDEPPGFQRHTAKAIWTDAVKMVILKVETGMDKKQKAVADLAVSILGNVAVVGIGLALYEQRWWCLAIATFATIVAGGIAWRSNRD